MKASEDHWMSISDLMSGLMIIFMFIAIAFMIKVQNQQKHMDNIVQDYATIKENLYNDLYEEFKDDLPKWHAELDKQTLSMRFQEPDILFDTGSASLKYQFQQTLNDFLPRYIRLLTSPQYKDSIQEIRIEGHTSTDWYGQTGINAYFKNMELSQARTRSVLEYAIRMPYLQPQQEWLISKITANGLSSSQPIIINGVENKEKSRRVEFRIRTNADEKMELLKDMKKDE
ncbi:MAG: OmpA family protein [Selenomonadaceae bacterium]|nr:OmpA family protein [Selenomonadaceae bacterium]